jgi:putative spermidine/putrescine transport system substrate-binding protein
MKRTCLLFVLLLASAALLFATGQAEKAAPAAQKDVLAMSWDELVAAAKQEGQVVLYVWYKDSFFVEAMNAFKQQYGIDAKFIMGDRMANFNKALAEKDQAVGTIDTMVVGGDTVKPIIDFGMMIGPMKPRIPHADKLTPVLWEKQEGVDTKGYLVPLMRNQTGLLYDPQRVSNPPQTWAELTAFVDANPKQFGFCDPSKGGSGQAFVQILLNYEAGGLDRYYGDTELDPADVANWNQAWDWVNQRKDKLTITASNNDSIKRLNDGELSLVVAWDDVVVDQMNTGGLFKRAKLYIPQMGSPGGGDTLGVLKNAPHKAAAVLLVSFLTDTAQQKAINIVGLYPARTDVAVEKTMLTEQERKYSVPWVPAPYKKEFIAEFVKNCLMK